MGSTPLEQYDGSSALTVQLDDESVLVYMPAFGLPESVPAELQAALAASEEQGVAPPEDACICSGSGRRQWFVEVPDRPLGWEGPRRWRRASWRLQGDDQLQPIIKVRSCVEEAAARFVNNKNTLPAQKPTERIRLLEVYNTVLVNRYPTGADSIKWHCDDERWYYVDHTQTNADIVIASVSVGAPRWFELRSHPQRVPKDQRRTVRIRLGDGSLLFMAGATQRNWQHRLPADEAVESMRINLTFRRVVPPRSEV